MAELAGLRVTGVAAGLWHTLCITDCGATYAFGGNQFGQLGLGGDRAEVCYLLHLASQLLYHPVPGLQLTILSFVQMVPKLVEGRLDEEVVVSVSCGARHSVALTGNSFKHRFIRLQALRQPTLSNTFLPTGLQRVERSFAGVGTSMGRYVRMK